MPKHKNLDRTPKASPFLVSITQQEALRLIELLGPLGPDKNLCEYIIRSLEEAQAQFAEYYDPASKVWSTPPTRGRMARTRGALKVAMDSIRNEMVEEEEEEDGPTSFETGVEPGFKEIVSGGKIFTVPQTKEEMEEIPED